MNSILQHLSNLDMESLMVDRVTQKPLLVYANDAYDMESLDYRPDVFVQFTDLFDKLQKTKSRTDQYKVKKMITALVWSTFGLTVDFKLIANADPDAFVMIPNLDNNHPLYSSTVANFDTTVFKKGLTNSDTIQVPRMDNTIDVRLGKVTGALSEITFQVSLSDFFMDAEMSPAEESAAVFLHEVGHCYSTCLFVGRSFFTNFVLAAALRELNGTTDAVYRQKIILATANTLGQAMEEYDEIAKVKDNTVQEELLLGQVQRLVISDQASFVYDRRAAEHFSDYFVGRMGGALPLSQALDRIQKNYGSLELRKNSWIAHISATIGLLGFLFTGLFIPVSVFILLNGPMGSITTYGTANERFSAIARQVAEQLKQRIKNNPDSDDLFELSKSYKAIISIASEYTENKTILDWICDELTHKQTKISEQQRQLEKLNASALFALAVDI